MGWQSEEPGRRCRTKSAGKVQEKTEQRVRVGETGQGNRGDERREERRKVSAGFVTFSF